jgi:hypothetical protein
MATATDFSENLILDTLLPNGVIYLALFSSAPTEAGGGTEVAGGGYARQLCDFDPAAGGVSLNTDPIQFTNMPATTVTHWAVFDSNAGGNMLVYGALTSPQIFSAGQPCDVAAGEVQVTCD